MKVINGNYLHRTVLIMLLLILPPGLYGQSHLAFLGHPITGDMKSFVAALKGNGFTTKIGKNWFPKMTCKYLQGDFWNFPNCDIVIRKPKKTKYVTSVYIHPKSNFLLLNELIGVLDRKYGKHEEAYSDVDVNALTYTWDLPEGVIQIFGTIVYGQSFDIIYRDYTEVNMLNHIVNTINNDL
jgi:hypothetical protein